MSRTVFSWTPTLTQRSETVHDVCQSKRRVVVTLSGDTRSGGVSTPSSLDSRCPGAGTHRLVYTPTRRVQTPVEEKERGRPRGDEGHTGGVDGATNRPEEKDDSVTEIPRRSSPLRGPEEVKRSRVRKTTLVGPRVARDVGRGRRDWSASDGETTSNGTGGRTEKD